MTTRQRPSSPVPPMRSVSALDAPAAEVERTTLPCRSNEPAEAAAALAALDNATLIILTDSRRANTGATAPIFNLATRSLIAEDGIFRDIVLSDLDEPEIVTPADAIWPNDA